MLDDSRGGGRPSRVSDRGRLGQKAEDLACAHLRAKGFEVLGRNVRVGRLELDIIAHRSRMIVFCEVRSRSNITRMTPAQTLGPAKIARLRSAAAQWLRACEMNYREVRFDVASVYFAPDGPRLNYLEGAL